MSDTGVEPEVPRVVVDPVYGFRRLEPIPTADELTHFYQSRYYHLIRAGSRAAGLKRLLEQGAPAERERKWLEHTLYGDVAESVSELAPGSRVLDVGCGTGDLVAFLVSQGIDAQGLEPSPEATQIGRDRGLTIHEADLGQYVTTAAAGSFDAVVMINVLEHVPDPEKVLAEVQLLLADNGLLIVQVPNDFSAIQKYARRILDKEPWWIAIPDHISYFDFASLELFLSGNGFETLQTQGDFPMELFLLLGQDYAGNPEVGSRCHGQRVLMEMALERPERRSLYQNLASAGLGRNCLLVARKTTRPLPKIDMSSFRRGAGGYEYFGLRHQDIQLLRGFRNAQMVVLRQKRRLTEADQERWYAETVRAAHTATAPTLLLVSVVSGGEFIGYGGLTNIDWDHRRAEVSFLVSPERAAQPDVYGRDFASFLSFLQHWAFDELGLARLFTETYAFRSRHVAILERSGFAHEGTMVAHTRDPDGNPVDSLLHGVTRPGPTT